jgi:hypothetical protein
MPRLYHYVGPDDIRRRAADAPPGVRIKSSPELAHWCGGGGGHEPVHRILPRAGVLAASGRRSRPCRRRAPQEVIFRRRLACGQIIVVKDCWFVCELCGADLPATWNF